MPLQKRHEERKSKLENNILDSKRNYTEAPEERKTIKSMRFHGRQLAKEFGS